MPGSCSLRPSALLLRPLPYPQAGRLVILWNRSPGLGITEDWFSSAQYIDVKHNAPSLEDDDQVRGMRSLGQHGGGARQAGAHGNRGAIVQLMGRRGDHQLGGSVVGHNKKCNVPTTAGHDFYQSWPCRSPGESSSGQNY